MRYMYRTPGLAACAALAICAVVATSVPAAGARTHTQSVLLENLDRGLVAAHTEDGIFLSWRLLASEVTGSGSSGLVGVDFNVYRDGQLLATVSDSTNYLDTGGTSSAEYRVIPTSGGKELGSAAVATAWEHAFVDMPLIKPADGVTPAGQAYTYRANDISVGDVDGDGALEYVVKWDPTNQKDNSQVGYTGSVYVDTYELDGTLLNRIDLGVNIRAGAHYTQFLVYDFDGDGRSEIMLKTAPGTKTVRYQGNVPAGESYVTMPAEDIAAGYSQQDDYRLSSAGYYEHLVDVFQGWGQHPEVLNGDWPATLEEAFGIAATYSYPLSEADARSLVDYFMDVYAPSRSSNNKFRQFEGFILSGPEYLSVFDGSSGQELETIRYEPGREDDGLLWGDYASARIEPGNRVDRFLAGVAYLDGTSPSAIFARGYYTRSTVAAYDWDGEHLSRRWLADSGWTPSTNPFANGASVGEDPEWGTLVGQGFHSLSAADVDGDGKHEIVYGSATLDDDGKLLYSSSDVTPPQSSVPNQVMPLGHGDAMHVTDIDPARPGLEIFTVHENTRAPYGMAMRAAETGDVLFGTWAGRDTGRGMIGDVFPDVPGIEVWGIGLHTADGQQISSDIPGTNQSIRWAADMTTQTVRNSGDVAPIIHDYAKSIPVWEDGIVLNATGTLTNNSTKGNPGLVADVFGDWREELLVRTTDSSAIRIYLSTDVTDRKMYTLLQDPQYRAEVARQQTSYNQPSYPGFYLASDVDWSTIPVPEFLPTGALTQLAASVADLAATGDISQVLSRQLTEAVEAAAHHLDAGRVSQALDALDRFEKHLGKRGDAGVVQRLSYQTALIRGALT
ncbi:rhamnogalacturonan lyase [Microbacterium sp. Marseille-Q6648]|uniref:rhamnogalacturonan lyase n=1 Tax=Microbacterium sp. Marseille-Q6648 TaxID=2937991 RepID=UPI00203E77F5|nr:rhamnogalacturonan lyase [Microbacterium sp. Marseille-Q6648]